MGRPHGRATTVWARGRATGAAGRLATLAVSSSAWLVGCASSDSTYDSAGAADAGAYGNGPSGATGPGSGSATTGSGGTSGGTTGGNGSISCITDTDCPSRLVCAGGVCAAAGTGDGAHDAGTPPLPQEMATTVPLARPIASAHYVFVLEAATASVARIDSAARAVRSLPLGGEPAQAAAIPGTDTLVVLNRGSFALQLVRDAASDSPDAEALSVPLGERYSDLAVSPGGGYAIAYFRDGSVPPAEARAKLAIVDLAAALGGTGADAVFERAVETRVTDVLFDESGNDAFVVTRRSVSVAPLLELASTPVLPAVTFTRAESRDVEHRQIAATADGRWIFVRHSASTFLEAVDTTARSSRTLDLGAIPTDLDVAPDGRSLVIVIRRAASSGTDGGTEPEGRVLLVDVPEDLDDPSGIRSLSTGDAVVGQAALPPPTATANRGLALLYTNAVHREELTWLDLDTGALTTRAGVVAQAVDSVLFAPYGRTALVTHRPSAAPRETDPTEQSIDAQYGLSILAVDAPFSGVNEATPQVLVEAPSQLAFSDDGAFAAALLSTAQRVLLIDLRRALVAQELALESPPRFIGFLHGGFLPGDATLFVAQEHPAGRITFVDALTDDQQTVTGFEVNSELR